MSYQRGNRGGYQGGYRQSSHPERQDETRRYGNRQGYGNRSEPRGRGDDRGERQFLFQHKQEPVQYADNGFTVVSSYAFPPNQRFPEATAFIDVRDFYFAQRENGAEFLCATSRGCKIPIHQAKELLKALAEEIAWVETTHPELVARQQYEQDQFGQNPEDEVPF